MKFPESIELHLSLLWGAIFDLGLQNEGEKEDLNYPYYYTLDASSTINQISSSVLVLNLLIFR